MDEFILFFKSFWCKIASAARNWINSVTQTAATTFAFSSVFILLLWALCFHHCLPICADPFQIKSSDWPACQPEDNSLNNLNSALAETLTHEFTIGPPSQTTAVIAIRDCGFEGVSTSFHIMRMLIHCSNEDLWLTSWCVSLSNLYNGTELPLPLPTLLIKDLILLTSW